MSAGLKDDEVIVFDMYFAGIVSMAHCHPGTTRDAALNLSLEACADKAMKMVDLRRKIIAGEYPWPG